MNTFLINFSPFFFLIGTFLSILCSTSLSALGRFRSKELIHSNTPPLFFYYFILKRLFFNKEWDHLHFSLSLVKNITTLGYAIAAFLFLSAHVPEFHVALSLPYEHLLQFASIGGYIVLIALIVHWMAYLIALFRPIAVLHICAPLTSCYLTLFLPVTLPILKVVHLLFKQPQGDTNITLMEKGKIREMIRESDLEPHLDPTDQQLITSFLNFKGRVAKEIMVPRVDVYTLPADSNIEETAPLFATEGYSRIPIYRESLDQIVGVVLYKDLLKYYADPHRNPHAPLESIAKPVLYAPENKKITQLLQEFRGKQIHMAIIVDEYGGTEGIVTIEDILEELVGEIEDEYDIGEEHDFWHIPGDGWVVDAKMTVHDIEERLGLIIPGSPEYETIGGYVYHCAGTIPAKGWRLSHDAFDLEVLSSTERAIKKIKIMPREKQ